MTFEITDLQIKCCPRKVSFVYTKAVDTPCNAVSVEITSNQFQKYKVSFPFLS